MKKLIKIVYCWIILTAFSTAYAIELPIAIFNTTNAIGNITEFGSRSLKIITPLPTTVPASTIVKSQFMLDNSGKNVQGVVDFKIVDPKSTYICAFTATIDNNNNIKFLVGHMGGNAVNFICKAEQQQNNLITIILYK